MTIDTIISVVYAILGISVIIFIHELGHFLAAKWVGVRVDRFSVGFDPTVFGFPLRFFAFKRGDTEYVFGMIPFGGYVKMAGETLLDSDTRQQSPKSDWLVSKSPGARAVVFAAGAAFNVISAFLFFAIAFTVGVSFFETKIGWVSPGQPAWEKGLRPGDKIVGIDGEPVSEFTEVIMAVAFADPDQTLAIEYLPAGSDTAKTVYITPRMSETDGFQSIGVRNAIDPTVRQVVKDGVAAKAGAEEGDEVIAANLGGLELTVDDDLPFHVVHREIANFVGMHAPGRPMKLKIRKPDGTERWLDFAFDKTDETQPLLGVLAAPGQAIAAVRPGSPLQGSLEPGDRVLSVNGKQIGSLSHGGLQTALDFMPLPRNLEIEIERGLETMTVDFMTPVLVNGLLRGDLEFDDLRIELGAIDDALPGAGLEKGDVLYSVGGTVTETPSELEQKLADNSSTGAFDVVVIRNGARVAPFSVERAALTKLAGEDHSKLTVLPRVLVRPGSAAAAIFGIETGSRILKIDGETLGAWEHLTAQVQNAGDKQVEIVWETAAGEEKSAKGKIQSTTYQALGLAYRPGQIIKKVGLLESTVVGLERVKIVAQQVILTLRGLVRRQVKPKNLAGPVGIVYAIYRFSEYGIGTLIFWLALISVNLGIINLLPFPILDGGHLLFLLIEKVKGSPLDIRIQEFATTVAFFMIIALAIYVTWNDLDRLLS